MGQPSKVLYIDIGNDISIPNQNFSSKSSKAARRPPPVPKISGFPFEHPLNVEICGLLAHFEHVHRDGVH